jgi:hypothetical protein
MKNKPSFWSAVKKDIVPVRDIPRQITRVGLVRLPGWESIRRPVTGWGRRFCSLDLFAWVEGVDLDLPNLFLYFADGGVDTVMLQCVG